MEEREIKIIQRTIDRLSEIIGGPPFEVRSKVWDFISQLEAVVESNAEGSEAAPNPKSK